MEMIEIKEDIEIVNKKYYLVKQEEIRDDTY
jgi:hypothetical protein